MTHSLGHPGSAPPEDHCLRLSFLPLGLPGWASGGEGSKGMSFTLSILLTELFSSPTTCPKKRGHHSHQRTHEERVLVAWDGKSKTSSGVFGKEFKPTFTKYLSSDGTMKTSGVTGSCA